MQLISIVVKRCRTDNSVNNWLVQRVTRKLVLISCSDTIEPTIRLPSVLERDVGRTAINIIYFSASQRYNKVKYYRYLCILGIIEIFLCHRNVWKPLRLSKDVINEQWKTYTSLYPIYFWQVRYKSAGSTHFLGVGWGKFIR